MGWPPRSSFNPSSIRGVHHLGDLPYGSTGYGLGARPSYSLHALDFAGYPPDRPFHFPAYDGDPLPSFAEGFGDYGARMPRVVPWGIIK